MKTTTTNISVAMAGATRKTQPPVGKPNRQRKNDWHNTPNLTKRS